MPACGATVKLHFIVPRRVAEKPPEKRSAPGPRVGPRPPDFPLGPLPHGPPPPFRHRQVCYDKDVILLPRVCQYAVQLIAI